MKSILFFALIATYCLSSCNLFKQNDNTRWESIEYSLDKIYVDSLDYSNVELLKIDASYFDTSLVKLLKKCSNVKRIRFVQERGELKVEKLELFCSSFAELGKLEEVSIEFDSILFVPNLVRNHLSIKKLNLSGYYIGHFDTIAFSSSYLESVHLDVKVIGKTEVNFSECPNLVSLFVSTGTNPDFNFKNLNYLESFQLSNSKIQTLPREVYLFRNLRTLILHTSSVKFIDDEIGKLSELDFFMLNDCCQLLELPDALGNLSQLSSITVRNAPRIEKIPPSYSNLESLMHFSIEASDKLTSIQPITQLTSLQRLTMIGVDPFPAIDELRQMERLTYLRISLNTLFGRSKEELTIFKKLNIEKLGLDDRIFTIDQKTNTCEIIFLDEYKSIETYEILKSILPRKLFR